MTSSHVSSTQTGMPPSLRGIPAAVILAKMEIPEFMDPRATAGTWSDLYGHLGGSGVLPSLEDEAGEIDGVTPEDVQERETALFDGDEWCDDSQGDLSDEGAR